MFALPLLAWRLAAFSAEMLLFLTHSKVLMCAGQPYSSAELSSKRWTYFLFDAVSPWNSLAAILAGNSSTGSSEAAALLKLLVLTAVGHGALHLYYIATWDRKHACNVIQMSAVSDMRSRSGPAGNGTTGLVLRLAAPGHCLTLLRSIHQACTCPAARSAHHPCRPCQAGQCAARALVSVREVQLHA